MWRPAFEVFAPSPVRGSPPLVSSAISPVRGPQLVRAHAGGSSPAGPDSGTSSPQWPRSPQLHPAVAEERLQDLLDLAQVSGEGMSAALSRVEHERDTGRQELTVAAAVIERQRGELERNSVVVQANQQRADALRQALQLAEQQTTAWRHGSPQLDRQQVVREELATAMRRRRARAWALRRWSLRSREAELMTLSRRCAPLLSHRLGSPPAPQPPPAPPR